MDEADIAIATDRRIVGRIRLDSASMRRPFILDADPDSPRAAGYRELCSHLQHLRSVVITSSVEGEGATTTAINVAGTLADTGRAVLLIDADLRCPRIADLLGLEPAVGLTTVLVGLAQVGDVVQPVGNRELYVLAAGRIPPSPVELFASDALKRVIAAATVQYDIVVIDSPPVLSKAGSSVLPTMTDGALLVVGSGEVTRRQLAEAISSLEAVGAKILGIVLSEPR